MRCRSDPQTDVRVTLRITSPEFWIRGAGTSRPPISLTPSHVTAFTAGPLPWRDRSRRAPAGARPPPAGRVVRGEDLARLLGRLLHRGEGGHGDGALRHLVQGPVHA